MAKKNKSSALVFLFLCSMGIMVIPFIASCGKGSGTLPAGSNVQLQILNLSPDLLPVNLYIHYIIQSRTNYIYPSPSGYFGLSNIDTPLQIRSSSTTSGNLVSIDSILKANTKYTLFITGLKANNSITSIFTIDTAAIPTVGRGKIRFVNASINAPALDITANGTLIFTNQLYKGVSKFVEVPPGNYEFKILSTGTTANELSDLKNVTIMDGKLYTLYSYGIAGHITDTAAFGSGVLSNR